MQLECLAVPWKAHPKSWHMGWRQCCCGKGKHCADKEKHCAQSQKINPAKHQ